MMIQNLRTRHAIVRSRLCFVSPCPVLLLSITLICLLFLSPALADPNYEYVREVLEEEAEFHGQDNSYYHEDSKPAQDETSESSRRAQERDAEFEAKVQNLSRQEQKKARQKKKQDARLVSCLLRASGNRDYYAVLGLSRKQALSQSIPQWLRRLVPSEKLRFFDLSASDIRKAYRSMATRVHPDKNHDGRADRAFMALEDAYSILSDKNQREEYDETWSFQSWDGWNDRQTRVVQTTQATLMTVVRVVTMVKKVVGPFAVPVGILAAVFL